MWSKKQQYIKLTDEDLRIKAAGVNFSIFTISDEITKIIREEIKDLSGLQQEEINKLFFVVSYVILFEAQKFFWECIIKDKRSAKNFESHLYYLFEKSSGINPEIHIKDFANYIQKIGPPGEIQYIGSKICRLLEKEDAFLMLNISAIFGTYLQQKFQESMERAWELPNETLKKMLGKLEFAELLEETRKGKVVQFSGEELIRIGKIAQIFIKKGRSDNPPKFVIFMGGVGAGKTTIRKEQYADGYVHFEFAEVYTAVKNTEGANPRLNEYANLASGLILRESIESKKNIVTEIIGADINAINLIIDKMREKGYQISVQEITADVIESYKRHLKAIKEDPEYISAYFTEKSTISMFYQQLGL